MLGFGWFLLIIMASYTANLASILVALKTAEGIGSIEDAIAQKVSICIVPQVAMEMASSYPTGVAFFKQIPDARAIVRISRKLTLLSYKEFPCPSDCVTDFENVCRFAQ